jgi:hypothetical protein
VTSMSCLAGPKGAYTGDFDEVEHAMEAPQVSVAMGCRGVPYSCIQLQSVGPNACLLCHRDGHWYAI